MDTAQWPQQENIGLIVKPMEEMVSNINACSTNNNKTNNNLDQRKTAAIRPPKEQALNCPRCNSTNTKFCYYNNYSLTQPRYFCKTCRRYWTEGGSLRNVPVGGGSRKNRRSSSSSSSSTSTSSSSKILTSSSHQNPKIHETQDLNLAFHTMSEFVHELPNIGNNSTNFSTTSTTTASATSLSEMLRNGINSSSSRGSNLMMNGGGSNNFMPTNADNSTTVNYSTGFALQDFKPSSSTLNFGIDHGLGSVGGIYGGVHHHHHHHHQQQHQENSNGIMRPLFPFEDLRQVSSTTTTTTNEHNHDQDHQFHEQNRTGQGDSNGYWSGMLGGGSW